jgi:hypothetical protein
VDREDADALPVVELDDREVGVRAEDQYVTFPPQHRRIRRRDHRGGGSAAPALLLVGLVALFLAASWLGGLASEPEAPDSNRDPVPPLTEPTDTRLVLAGAGTVSILDVDTGAQQPLVADAPPIPARDAAALDEHVVVLTDDVEVIPLAGGEIRTAGAAAALVASRDAVWIVEPRRVEVDAATPIRADGSTGTSVELPGTLVAATRDALVVERDDGVLERQDPSGNPVGIIADDLEVLAASSRHLATAVSGCAGQPCDLVLVDLRTTERTTIPDALGQPGLRHAAFSPDGSRLAVTFSDGIVARGLLVDVPSGAITRFSTDSVRRSDAALTWSPDGAWLFIAVERDRLEVVDASGATYAVEVPETSIDAIVSVSGDGSG